MADERGLLDVIPDAAATPPDIHSNELDGSSRSHVAMVRQRCKLYFTTCVGNIAVHHREFPHTTYTTAYYLIASICTLTLMCTFAYNPSTEKGTPQDISCRNWFWSDPQACGVDAAGCTPFTSGPFPVRCPSKCNWHDPSLIVYGDNDNGYHARSRICVAALHAKVIPPAGGCALVQLTGSAKKFYSSLGGGGIVSKFRNESYYKTFKLTAIDDYNCPGFGHQMCVLIAGYLFCAVSVCLPSRWIRPPLVVLFAQPWAFGCFYLALVNNMGLSNSGSGRMLSAISGLSFLLFAGAIYFYYTKDRLLELIDINAVTTSSIEGGSFYGESFGGGGGGGGGGGDDDGVSPNDDNDAALGDALVPPQPAQSRWTVRAQYIFLYLTPMFVALHLSWIDRLSGNSITLDASIFQLQGLALVERILFLVACLVLFVYIFIHLARIAYKENRLVPVLGAYGGYTAMLIATRAALLPCYGVHLHHAWLAAVVLFGINFKSKVALFVAGVFSGIFVDGIITWKEYTVFLNIWQPGVCSSSGGGGPPPSPGPPPPPPPHGFNVHTGNLTSFEVYPTNITVTFPSAWMMNEIFSLGAQGAQLILNEMVKFEALHRNAVREGYCNQTHCTYIANNLYDGASYTFQYHMLGSGNRVVYQSPPLQIFTPSL
jgi:hypothetical protein